MATKLAAVRLTPVEEAARVYEREDCVRTFREDVEAHLLNGYVFSTPEYFCMGRMVRRNAAEEDIVNPWVAFEPGECDAWMVYLVAGDMKAAWSCFPQSLDWIGFERENVLRWHRFQGMEERVRSAAEAGLPGRTISP